MGRDLKTDEVIAEEPVNDFAMGDTGKQLRLRPGHMPEMGDGAQDLRRGAAGNKAEVVVVDPYGGNFARFPEDRFGK